MKPRLVFRQLLVGAGLLGLAVGSANAADDCGFSTNGTAMKLDGDCTTDATILIPNGFTLNGKGHSITAVDPPGGQFRGGVVQNQGAVAHVRNLTVTALGLANRCDAGADRLRGILFAGARGTIVGNRVTGINQFAATGQSGCQEGNAIEVRNPPFDGTHPNTQTVTIKGNLVEGYQKGGIVANGDVAVKIRDNRVTGAGAIDFIAQNGIQIGFGATGRIRDNDVSDNAYTPVSFTATDVLIFAANDVVVRDNEVRNGEVGIFVVTSNRIRVGDNEITDPANIQEFNGVAVIGDDNRIEENEIEGSNESGIYLLGARNKVVENEISNTPTGIFIDTGSDATRVVENEFESVDTPIDDNGVNTILDDDYEGYLESSMLGIEGFSAVSMRLFPSPFEE